MQLSRIEPLTVLLLLPLMSKVPLNGLKCPYKFSKVPLTMDEGGGVDGVLGLCN